MQRLDLTGKRFGRLLVIRFLEVRGRNRVTWECKCDCGNTSSHTTDALRSKRANSCGCLKREAASKVGKANIGNAYTLKHGMKNTRTYHSWVGMMQRCYNPSHNRHYLYLEKGIQVCDRWRNSFLSFLEDMGQAPEGRSLDRINNNGNYEPGNCRWATPKEQANNRSIARMRRPRQPRQLHPEPQTSTHPDTPCQLGSQGLSSIGACLPFQTPTLEACP